MIRSVSERGHLESVVLEISAQLTPRAISNSPERRVY
jgi:hypothetical protein